MRLRIGLKIAKQDVARRTGAGDKGTNRSDERRNRRIHGSRRLDGRPGNLRSHPAVAHDLSRSNDGDDGNNGISQSHDGLAQYSHHFTKAGRLHSTTDKRRPTR